MRAIVAGTESWSYENEQYSVYPTRRNVSDMIDPPEVMRRLVEYFAWKDEISDVKVVGFAVRE